VPDPLEGGRKSRLRPRRSPDALVQGCDGVVPRRPGVTRVRAPPPRRRARVPPVPP
jgi:hypothetical protein